MQKFDQYYFWHYLHHNYNVFMVCNNLLLNKAGSGRKLFHLRVILRSILINVTMVATVNVYKITMATPPATS